MAHVEEVKEIVLPDSYGIERRVGDLWTEAPVVLVWLRHYG